MHETFVESFPAAIPEKNDTERIKRAIVNAVSNGNKLVFKPNTSYTVNTFNVDVDGLEIIGNGAFLVSLEAEEQSLRLTGSSNIQIRNLRTKGVSVKVLQSSDVLLDRCLVTKTISSGVYLDGSSKVELWKTIITNTGTNPSLNPTYQGCGVYITNNCKSVKIEKCDISLTCGHGAVFINGTHENINIIDNDIYNVAYRGVGLFDAHATTGHITRNRIKRTGFNKPVGSGVGCNGIFSNEHTLSNMIVTYNTIEDVMENGIEGNFKVNSDNIIINTGIDPVNYPTPSPEGIWGNNSIRNIIINPHGHGIKYYSSSKISDVFIEQNTIISGDNTKKLTAIDINSGKSYENVNIVNNTSTNFDYCVNMRNNPEINCKLSGNEAAGKAVDVYKELAR